MQGTARTRYVLPQTGKARGVVLMAGYYPVDRGEWLLRIGRRLRTEYDDIIAAVPLPERVASLLKQLEEAIDNPRQAA
jgi:hypothetical protein